MESAKEVRKGEALDWDSLESYLKKAMPDLQGRMKTAQFHGGHANLTYLVDFDGRELIVRRPPFGKIAPGAHDMKREFRVLSKLYRTYPRAPRAFHFCEDDNVIGSPFVVIERRRGVVVRSHVLDCHTSFENVEMRLVDAMIKAMAELHLVDYVEAGLEGLGKPVGFVERQVKGWAKRWELSQLEEDENMTVVIAKLKAKIPIAQRASIIHNDIKLDNCQFQESNPDEVSSIFDWDMCTLGDPLIDVGTTLSYYPNEHNKKFKSLPIQLKGDFPPKAFLLEKYEEYTGLNTENIAWYEAFANMKGVVVAQQLYARYKQGASTDPRMEAFGAAAKDLAVVARAVISA